MPPKDTEDLGRQLGRRAYVAASQQVDSPDVFSSSPPSDDDFLLGNPESSYRQETPFYRDGSVIPERFFRPRIDVDYGLASSQYMTQEPRSDFDLPPLPDLPVVTAEDWVLDEDEASVMYMPEYAASFKDLVAKVETDEVEQFRRPLPHFSDHAMDVLCSMETEVVKSIIDGTLARVVLSDDSPRPSARKFLKKYEADWLGQLPNEDHQPVIYAQYLTDAFGQPPDKGQAAKILDLMYDYVDDPELARLVDKAVRPDDVQGIDWAAGERRYLTSSDQRAKLLEFVQNARRHLHGPETERMKRPWAEFGYTIHAKARLEAHKKHQSSTFIMNLAEAVCVRHFREYEIRQFVVFKVWAVEQAWAAEMLLTRLGGGYTMTGLGFNHHQAGQSNDSANKVVAGLWCDYGGHALRYSPLHANYKRQTEILVERERKAAEEELQRVEAEIAGKERELNLRKDKQHAEQIRSKEKLHKFR